MLLVALLLRLGERVRSDTLIDLLWADHEPRDSANALQILIAYLRKTLPSDLPGGSVIVTVDRGYQLGAARISVDAYRMEEAVSSAAAEAYPRWCLRILDAALCEWRGTPAPEREGEALAPRRGQRDPTAWSAATAFFLPEDPVGTVVTIDARRAL